MPEHPPHAGSVPGTQDTQHLAFRSVYLSVVKAARNKYTGKTPGTQRPTLRDITTPGVLKVI